MKNRTNYYFALFLTSLLALSACQTIEELSIDYMLPGEISFPASLKRVAIVNNTTALPDNKIIPSNGSPKENETNRRVAYHTSNASIATTSLAEAIARENYFDLVVICDSALRSKDFTMREGGLLQEEVQQLAQSLGVDFIISLENLQFKTTKVIQYLPQWSCYQGTVDTKVYPTVKIYLPIRKKEMVQIHTNDSIFWEEFASTEANIHRQLPQDLKIIEEASVFAGTVPVKKLLPYWKTGKRYLYTNGSVPMRDAIIYIRRESWEQAFNLWKEAYSSSKKAKKQMAAAHNLAVYYEMQDDIEHAEKWALKARECAHKVENVGQISKNRDWINRAPNYVMVSLYLQELQERKNGLAKLNMQMNRFNDDF